jgi:hypothetical protein
VQHHLGRQRTFETSDDAHHWPSGSTVVVGAGVDPSGAGVVLTGSPM